MMSKQKDVEQRVLQQKFRQEINSLKPELDSSVLKRPKRAQTDAGVQKMAENTTPPFKE
jgi:hypothetical protein